MSLYRVEIARRALKVMSGLPRREQQRVRAAIDLLAEQPLPPGCVSIVEEEHAYRVRVGDHRIVYEVFDDRLLIQVIRVGHRKGVYRK